MNWIYASQTEKPELGEEVLCDLGKREYFYVLVYSGDGDFYDPLNRTEYYRLGDDVKRWCHIGKHCDEQF